MFGQCGGGEIEDGVTGVVPMAVPPSLLQHPYQPFLISVHIWISLLQDTPQIFSFLSPHLDVELLLEPFLRSIVLSPSYHTFHCSLAPFCHFSTEPFL